VRMCVCSLTTCAAGEPTHADSIAAFLRLPDGAPEGSGERSHPAFSHIFLEPLDLSQKVFSEAFPFVISAEQPHNRARPLGACYHPGARRFPAWRRRLGAGGSARNEGGRFWRDAFGKPELRGAHAMNTRRIITSAILALVITAMSVVGTFAVIEFPSPGGRRVAHLASMAARPAAYVVAVLGLGHGPHGLPNQRDVLVYVLTFLLWWGGIYGARV
jgi:hypothetical protein